MHFIEYFRELSNQQEHRRLSTFIMNEIENILDATVRESANQDLARSLQTMIEDFVSEDSFGNRQLNKKSFLELVHLFVPMFRSSLEHVSLPRIEGYDDNKEWVLEDAILHGRSILPEHIDIHHTGDINLRLPGARTVEHVHSEFTIDLSRMYFHLRNIRFHYRQKTGLHVADDVLAEIHLRGEGATIQMVMTADSGWKYTSKSVSCRIDGLKLKILDARHTMLYSILTPGLGRNDQVSHSSCSGRAVAEDC